MEFRKVVNGYRFTPITTLDKLFTAAYKGVIMKTFFVPTSKFDTLHSKMLNTGLTLTEIIQK